MAVVVVLLAVGRCAVGGEGVSSLTTFRVFLPIFRLPSATTRDTLMDGARVLPVRSGKRAVAAPWRRRIRLGCFRRSGMRVLEELGRELVGRWRKMVVVAAVVVRRRW